MRFAACLDSAAGSSSLLGLQRCGRLQLSGPGGSAPVHRGCKTTPRGPQCSHTSSSSSASSAAPRSQPPMQHPESRSARVGGAARRMPTSVASGARGSYPVEQQSIRRWAPRIDTLLKPATNERASLTTERLCAVAGRPDRQEPPAQVKYPRAPCAEQHNRHSSCLTPLELPQQSHALPMPSSRAQ